MSKLYVIPTPIGNLEDISFRAINALKHADLILVEDTRVSQKLLKHYEITTKFRSYHQHNEHKITPQIINELLENDLCYALISDAGTPSISDPGFLLIRSCITENIKVVCLPGSTAFLPALIQSGFSTDRFIYEGFLPHKKGRKKRILQLSNETRTIILYESPYRIIKLLKELNQVIDEKRKVSISREISKIHEETIIGTTLELINHFTKKQPKGEMVVVIESIKTDKKTEKETK